MMPRTNWEYVSPPQRTVILSAGHRADIFKDTKTSPPIFHCLVQKLDSSEILFWEQTKTFAEAEDDMLEQLDSHTPFQRPEAVTLLDQFGRSA